MNLEGMDIGDIESLAQNGDAEAQYKLGQLYAIGKRITQNPLRAIYWFRKAAVQGVAAAQYCLAFYYYYGEGVPQDTFVAQILWQTAAEHGHDEAKAQLEKYFK